MLSSPKRLYDGYVFDLMVLDAGMPSAVVLTGDAKAEDLQEGSEDVPEYVLERIDNLIPPSLRAERGWKDD